MFVSVSRATETTEIAFFKFTILYKIERTSFAFFYRRHIHYFFAYNEVIRNFILFFRYKIRMRFTIVSIILINHFVFILIINFYNKFSKSKFIEERMSLFSIS